MLRNAIGGGSSTDRRNNHSVAPAASTSPYKDRADRNLPAYPSTFLPIQGTFRMGLIAIFAAIFVLIVGSSFAIDEYSEDVHSVRGARARIASSGFKSAAPQHMSARSITEESEADYDAGEEDIGSFVGDGASRSEAMSSTLGSDLLSKMEQNLEISGKRQGSVKVERMLVHTGNVSLESPRGKVNELADKISNLIGSGYVEDRSESLSRSYWSNERDRKSIRMKLRVPSADFHVIVAEIQTLVDKDKVFAVSRQSRDVTDEYIDANARADTLSASRDALKTLLARANSIKDVISVKNELNRLTEQIESHKRKAVYLKKQANLSELTVTIEEEQTKRKDEVEKPSGWDPTRPMYLATNHLARLLGIAGDTAVYVSVWAVPCAIIFAIMSICWRRTAKTVN